MSIKYELSEDGKTAKKIETIESTVNVEEKENLVLSLESDIAAVPEIKNKPDQETLDFWNNYQNSKKAILSHQLEQLNIELDKIKGKDKKEKIK